MRLSVYTSCALNYLPKARALAKSLRYHHSDATLTLCLNDNSPTWLDLSAEPFDRIWHPSDLGYDPGWIFQHNVMELSTAVKGRALCRLIEEDDADLIVYLDPDVYVFAALDDVLPAMADASIGLVPHILEPEANDAGIEAIEMSAASHGAYNLGHLFVRPDYIGSSFAEWWAKRLDQFCFDDKARGLFTDQRWIDLVPSIFPGVRILKDPGLDVACWNISSRSVRRTGQGSRYTANETLLKTYHYSGTGPNGTHRRVREQFDAGNPASAEIERFYEEEISKLGQAEFSNLLCAFDFFDDGTSITARARRMYRDHPDLRHAFPQPFSCGENGGYSGWLRANRPGFIDGISLSQVQVRTAFDELFDGEWYTRKYPEVAHAISSGNVKSALDHYCKVGSQIMLDPNRYFVTAHYVERAGDYDTQQIKIHAGSREGTWLWHYLSVGLRNACEPIEFFDSPWYIAANPDVAAAMRTGSVSAPLAHFVKHGSGEGRDPGPGFRSARYLEISPIARSKVSEGNAESAFHAFVDMGGVAGRVCVEEGSATDFSMVTS
ncbi:MAG: hypothetical protein AAF674_10065 [Pseudomonadota bacterium]